MHNLEIVTVLNPSLAERRARHDLQIALDRDPHGIEAEAAYHLGNGGVAGYSAVLAIDPNSNAPIETHDGGNRSRRH
jgi:hypothetical protein